MNTNTEQEKAHLTENGGVSKYAAISQSSSVALLNISY